MKKVEVIFNASSGALFYGDIVEVTSGNNGDVQKFLIIQSGHAEAILIELDQNGAQWNRQIESVEVPSWNDFSTENFAEIFGFSTDVKVRKLASKTTLVYEYQDEINVGDVICWKINSNVSGIVRYKTKSEPPLYFIDEYQEGRIGLLESEIEKV